MSSSFDFYWFNLAFHPQMTKMLNQMTKNSEKISNNKKKKGKTTQNHNILHQVSDFTEKNSLFDEKSSLQTTSSQISQFTFEQKTTNFTKEQTFNENQTMNKNQTFNHQTFNKNQTMNQNQTFNHQTMNQNQTFNHQTMNKNQTFNHQTMNQNQTFNHQTMNKNQTFNHQTMNQNQTFNHQTMNQNQTFNHQTMNQNHITNQTIQKTNNPGDKTPIKLIINENRQLQIKSNKSVAQVLSKCSSANTLLQNRKSPGLPFKYDPGANHWTISLAHFTNAITLLKKHFTFDQIPNDTIKILEKNAKSEQKVVDQGIFDKNKKSDDNLSNDKNQINTSTDMILLHRISSFLLPHQREAVDIAIKKSGRLILADEMGLGKTITALAIAAYYKNDWPCLIICPSGLMENWRNEIDRFLNFELPKAQTDIEKIEIENQQSVLEITKKLNKKTHFKKNCILDVKIIRSVKDIDNQDVLIVSYDFIWRNIEYFKGYTQDGPFLNEIQSNDISSQTKSNFEKSTTIRTFFDIKRKINMVICDEAHYLKTRDSKRSRKIIPFLKKMNRVLLVTGTPALSRPLELYNLIDILITYKQSDFLNRYCLNNTSNNFKRDFNKYKGCSNVEELKMLLSTMMIRRTKELLMKDLPPKSREHFILECDEFINQLRFDSDDEEFIVDDQDTADILKDHHILENQPTDDITKNNFLSKFFKKKEETQVAVKEEPLDMSFSDDEGFSVKPFKQPEKKINEMNDQKINDNEMNDQIINNQKINDQKMNDQIINNQKINNKIVNDQKINNQIQTKKLEVHSNTDLSDKNTLMLEYKLAAHQKVESVKNYIKKWLEHNPTEKLVVFAHHRVMLNGIELTLQETTNNSDNLPFSYIRIDGSTPQHRRQGMVYSFQTDPIVRVALLSITSASTGITLHSSNTVIFTELWWNPGNILQAEDRVHRIGQKNMVSIIFLLGRNTIDEHVWPKLIQKLKVLEKMDVGENVFGDVGAREGGVLPFKRSRTS